MEYFYQEDRTSKLRNKSLKSKADTSRNKYISDPLSSFTVKTAITLDDIKKLDKTQFENPVISFYLTLSGYNTLRDPKNYITTFNSLKTETIKKRKEYVESMTSKEHSLFQQDIEEIREYIENGIVTSGFRSFVIFKSGKDLSELIQLPVPVRSAFVIDINPYTLPLEIALAENKQYLLVQFTKEHATISTYRFGSIQKETDLHAEILPDYSVNSTRRPRPGKDQRHIEHHHERHMKHVCEHISKRMGDIHLEGVIIIGHEKTETEKLINHFTKELTDKIIGADYISPEQQHDTNTILLSIQNLISKHEKKLEKEMIDVVERAEGKRELIMGLRQVIAAQNRGMLQHLYVNPYAHRGGYRCRTHTYLSLRPSDCPLCNKPTHRIENIIDELIEVSRTHNASTRLFVHEPHLLEMYESVAALPFTR